MHSTNASPETPIDQAGLARVFESNVLELELKADVMHIDGTQAMGFQ